MSERCNRNIRATLEISGETYCASPGGLTLGLKGGMSYI